MDAIDYGTDYNLSAMSFIFSMIKYAIDNFLPFPRYFSGDVTSTSSTSHLEPYTRLEGTTNDTTEWL